MTFRMFGPSPFARGSREASTVGVVDLYEHHADDGDRHIRAARVDRVTVIDTVKLGWARTGQLAGVHADSSTVVVEVENGRWVYSIGDYDPDYRGVMLTLIDGAPLQPRA